MGFMVLRVKPTPTRFPINILYAPVGQHTFAFDTNLLSSINACQSEKYPSYHSLMAKRKFLTVGHLFATAANPFHRV